MTKDDWIEIWSELGVRLQMGSDQMTLAKLQATRNNPWFTADHVDNAIEAIVDNFLQKDKLETWLGKYNVDQVPSSKNVGIICAGNIPLVGFQDVLCTLSCGHRALIKCSHKDQFLITAVFDELGQLYPSTKSQFEFVNRLSGHDAVIATGSNNSLRYFKSYFGHLPHIFRSNRTSVGVIRKEDNIETLTKTMGEVFLYFGLGCRNISKIYVPRNFDLNNIFEASQHYAAYSLHSKYRNNFIYHTALFQMNHVVHLTNDLFILLESEKLHSPLSVLYYERYDSLESVANEIDKLKQEIQVVYSLNKINGLDTIVPGEGQKPELWDYADKVDVVQWLIDISN